MENIWRQQQQQSNPIIPSHLPSQIFAPERLSELLTHGSYDNTKHKAVKKPTKKIIKYTTTTTTTRPPIVWFPGDPDCNDAATSTFTDTFQLIAFLLSVFNIATALQANANSNNNNNNLNDNKLNGNMNNVNEGNAMAMAESMAMIMPGRNLDFPVEPVFQIDEKTGDKLIHWRKKKKREIQIDHHEAFTENNIIDKESEKGKIASVIMEFLHLWMKSIAANSKDCQRWHFCHTNDQISRQSLFNWQLAEISTLGMAYKLGHQNQTDFKELLLAGQYGRQGLNCTELYEDCNINEQTFIEFARLMPWSPVGELKYVEKLVSWVWNR